MKEVTIICCYNDLKQYSVFLKSLTSQNLDFELIGIDNTNNKYKSCSEAFNKHILKVTTPYVIFSHQDIEFIDNNNLAEFVACIKRININDILGVAGRKEKGGTVITNIVQGNDKQYAGGKRIKVLTKCETIDECFFGGYTKNFRDHPFDEKVCNNWHLYAVDRCLNARKMKNNVYICPIYIIHKSKGKMNYIYNKQFYLLSKKYSKEISYLNTTCAYASTRFPFREISFVKRAVSLFLRRY